MNQATAIKPAGQVDLWDVIASGLERDGNAAAREHAAAGRPIYTAERDTPAGLLVKTYPNGNRELVRYARAGDEVIRPL